MSENANPERHDKWTEAERVTDAHLGVVGDIVRGGAPRAVFKPAGMKTPGPPGALA
jgi:hypothetical protein